MKASDDGKLIYQEKSDMRTKIAIDTEAYLAKGGTIYQVTSKDNSGDTVGIPRTRKQMIKNQQILLSKAIARQKEAS